MNAATTNRALPWRRVAQATRLHNQRTVRVSPRPHALVPVSVFMRSRRQQEPGWELGMLRDPNACDTGNPEAAQTRLLPSGSALASGGLGKRQGLPSSAKRYTTSHGQARYPPPVMRTVRLSQAVTFVHRRVLGLAIRPPERLGGKTGISLENHGRRSWNSITP
jgi:hypothetical protein